MADKEKKVAKKAEEKKAPKALTARMYDILLHPVITEKSSAVAGQNKIVFAVAPSSTKTEIKGAVETIYKVDVKSVNIAFKPGKAKRFKGVRGMTSATKKAYITLAEGHSIDIMAGAK